MTQQNFRFIADERWILLLRSSIRESIIKNIGSSAFSLYVLFRSEADLSTGGATISYETIRKLTGYSTSTISKSIEKLKTERLIRVEDVKFNLKRYYCMDIIPFVKMKEGDKAETIIKEIEEGNRTEYDGKAIMEYVPARMKQNRAELHTFLETGREPNSPNITIENFYLQININGTEAQFENVQDEELREILLRLAQKSKDKKALAENVVIHTSDKGAPRK